MIEADLQNMIRLEISDLAVVFRINVVSGKTVDGRFISSGVPKGYSDLSGHRIKDGKAFYFEVKTPTGRVQPEQQNFLNQMKLKGAIAEIVRSVEDARKYLSEGL